VEFLLRLNAAMRLRSANRTLRRFEFFLVMLEVSLRR
jgi:hypothetical protein